MVITNCFLEFLAWCICNINTVLHRLFCLQFVFSKFLEYLLHLLCTCYLQFLFTCSIFLRTNHKTFPCSDTLVRGDYLISNSSCWTCYLERTALSTEILSCDDECLFLTKSFAFISKHFFHHH